MGAAHGPEHTRLLAAGTDPRLAPGFDDSGAHAQVLAAELGLAHASAVAAKVFGLGPKLFGQFDRRGWDGRKEVTSFLILQVSSRSWGTILPRF